MRKFEFERTYEEIEIAGDIYKLDFSDDNLQNLQRAFSVFQGEIEELSKIDAAKMSDEEAVTAMERQKAAMLKLITALFGEDTFNVLYEKAGSSLLNLGRLLGYIGEILQEKAQELKPSKRAQYVKAVKQKAARKRA